MKRRYSWNEEERIERAILAAISQGSTKRQAADLAGIHRSTLFRWLERKDDFAAEFAREWDAGAEKRNFQLWLTDPFRGKRPPTSERTRAFPRYGKPRIRR